MSVTKERRNELWYWLDDPYKYDQEPIDTEGEEPHDPPTYGELRALLDMADERDLFRELLEAVWRAWPRNITAATLNRIKAALEGKHD